MKILLAVILLLVVFLLCLFHRYSHVNPALVPLGFLISAFTRYSTPKGLKRFARMAGTCMPLIFHERSHAMDTQKISIPGQDGNFIPIVIYKPKNARPDAAGFLWIHGGGYAIGTPGAEKNFLKPFVLQTNTIAVVPDYRLSPEAPYPAAFHDCCDALLWMKDHAQELGINENRICIGGCSAGGGLTAAVSLYARDTGACPIAFQMPIYPMINDRMDTASMIGNTEFLWDEKRNRAAWKVYLGDLYGTDKVPAYAAPARAKDYTGLPPTYTFVGTLDPFYDETLQYIEALKACGVEAKCDIYKGAFHGFDVIPAKISNKARAKLLEEYKHTLDSASVVQTFRDKTAT